ncbi:hypothetical protein [Pseudoxanthomonas sp. JBR18]|uniref:hypothetical protein n=1 Tax=Pseudoxanthomonas sp. JBR18 TaxID=2969308 RepID=UPI0023057A2E|nr:hypothetical protein [Pseudoxanthomonas sp. JBR18]WCE03168.1 hypothetical protein PJ250_13715 [Pseudoxanthomonas sp. JBR18]
MRSDLKRRIRAVEAERVQAVGPVVVLVAAQPHAGLIHVDEVQVERLPGEGDDHFHRRAGLLLGADHLILLVPRGAPAHAY